MSELSIRFTAENDKAPVGVSLSRLDSGAYTNAVPFTPPLDDPELSEIRWYLEDFHLWPTGPDYERADALEAKLKTWGMDLLKAATSDRDAIRAWEDFENAPGDGKLLTIDATDSRVLRLPWELLATSQGHLFARSVSIRRRLQQVKIAPARSFELPVRVLVLVSRPDNADFIDSRSDPQALLDALDGLAGQVEVEFLYPPTLKALTRRLRAKRRPPIHVVHFDGHGTYEVSKGLGYLLFENEAHKAVAVDAMQLGTLLSDCAVPLMVLSACQSAMQEEANPYASMATQLIESGVGSVLAMNYSVLVAATRIFVAAFYGALGDGLSIGKAVDEGRYALLQDEERHILTRRNEDGDLVHETIRLRDWFLPALYQQNVDPLVFPETDGEAQPTPRTLPRALTEPNSPGGLPETPQHGFHGRARELLKLERALAESAIVVVHGFGGMGKTTLAAEAGRWFHRTGRFPAGAAFVSFEHGGSLQQLCSWVGQAITNDPNFAVSGDGDPVERITELLRTESALVILDNFESALGSDPQMPPEELKDVLDAVHTWAKAGRTAPNGKSRLTGSRVLITTRDTTFNDARFAPSKECTHIGLGGLDRSDALALAAVILDVHGIDRGNVVPQDLIDLMDRLDAHPLSLNLVLPHLRDHTAAQLSDDFETLLPGFKTGAAKERNDSLTVSLEFSLNRLGQATRDALPALAVFQGGAMEEELLVITEIDRELWKHARAELEQAALVSVESIPGVEPPFLRFHPTLLPYLASQLDAARRAELEQRYWQRYHALAGYLYRADTETPHQARAVAIRELPNFQRALDLALAASERNAAVDFGECVGKFLDSFGRWRDRDAMMAKVAAVHTTSDSGPLTRAEFMMMSHQGDRLLQQGRPAEAERLFRALLKRLETDAAYDTAYDHALRLRSLGLCIAAQGRHEQALAELRRASQGFKALSESNKSAKEMLGRVGTDLGERLTELGRFDEAEQAYQDGLAISREVEDHRSVGAKLGNLGTLAMLRGDLAGARRRYTDALEMFRELGEPHSEAVAWHQLGRTAQEAKDWHEAERCYRESLRLEEQLGADAGVAQTCNQLAIVAQRAGRPDDAERWYLRAVSGLEETGQRQNAAKCASNLAGLYLSQKRYDEAEDYARRALAIQETQDLSAEPWKAYAILARIAEADDRTSEAIDWRRKEQETFAAYPAAAYKLPQWAPDVVRTVTDAAQGVQAAQQAVNELLPRMEGAENATRLAAAIRRILDGERDANALCRGDNHVAAYIIHAILDTIAGNPPEWLAASTPASAGATPSSRPEWAPDLIRAVVDATKGVQAAKQAVDGALPQLEQGGWGNLCAAIRRILDGERDVDALCDGVDAQDAFIIRAILDTIAGNPPEWLETASGPASAGATASARPDWVPRLVKATADATNGAQAARQAVDDALPQLEEGGWSALCAAVRRILDGERAVDALCEGADEQDADIIRAILDTIAGNPPEWLETASGPASAGATASARPDWVPGLVRATADATKGVQAAKQALDDALPQLEIAGRGDLCAAVRRILDGERDADTLCEGADDQDVDIIRAILDTIAGNPPEWLETASAPASAGATASARPDWVPGLVRATADATKGVQPAKQALDDALPQLEIAGRGDLCAAVHRILDGERDVDALCDGADAQDADIIRAILDTIAGNPPEWLETAPPSTGGEATAGTGAGTGRPEWVPGIVRVVADAANGVQAAQALVNDTLPKLEQGGWGNLCAAIRRILDGERDAGTLCDGVDAQDADIIRAILDTVAGNPPEWLDAVQQGTSIDDLLKMVAAARQPGVPQEATQQLRTLCDQMANAPDLPAELNAFGRVLSAILDGDAAPDLSGLTDDMAAKVRALLEED